MISKLFKEGYLNIEKLLLDKYNRLNLDEKEAIVLAKLFNLGLTKKSISFKALKSRLSFSTADLNQIIDSLVSKGFVDFEVSIKNDKQESLLNPESGLNKIEDFLKQEIKTDDLEEHQAMAKKIASFCEEELERALSSNDLITITHWVETGVPFETIKWAVFDSIRNGRSSVSYIDRVISNGADERDY